MKVLKRVLLSFISLLFLVAVFYYSGPTTAAPSYELSLPKVNTPLDAINDSLRHFDTDMKAERFDSTGSHFTERNSCERDVSVQEG